MEVGDLDVPVVGAGALAYQNGEAGGSVGVTLLTQKGQRQAANRFVG